MIKEIPNNQILFRDKPFEIEKLEILTRFTPISIFNINISNGRFLKIVYLFGVIPIWRKMNAVIPPLIPDDVDERLLEP